MDHGGGGQGRLHRPRQPLGERLHRELQRPAPRRAARRRDLLQLARGPGRDRELATALQPGAPACLARLPGTGTGGGPCATPASLTNHPGRGPTTSHALTFNPDHPAGAGQPPLALVVAAWVAVHRPTRVNIPTFYPVDLTDDPARYRQRVAGYWTA